MMKQEFANTSIKANQKTRLKKYGLTPEAYIALYESQNGKCKICQSAQVGETGGGKPKNAYWSFDIDHDHVSGRVRGLLCRHCNLMLGHAADNPTILIRAIQYLKGNL